MRSMEQSQNPRLIICPTTSAAESLVSDLVTLQETFIAPEHRKKIAFFPSWDSDLFSAIQPSLLTRNARIAVLNELTLQRSSLNFVVTDPQGAFQATLPPALIKKWSFQIQMGKNWGSRETLISQMQNLGYLRNESVEDPGCFSVRGDIVDLFPSGFEQPIRIQLFDELIERIRLFDIQTQKSKGDLTDPIWIGPAREVIINAETTPVLRAKIKQHADQLDIARPVRDPILEAIQSGHYPDHSEGWAPFAYAQPTSLLEYFNESSLIWFDESSVWDEWIDFYKSLQAHSQKKQSVGLILPAPQELYLVPEENQLTKKTQLYLDRIHTVDSKQEAVIAPLPATPPKSDKIAFWSDVFFNWGALGIQTVVFAPSSVQAERLKLLLKEQNTEFPLLKIATGSIQEGFVWESEKIAVLNESTVFGIKHTEKNKKNRSSAAKNWAGLKNLETLSINDLIVHLKHGIGHYLGLTRLNAGGVENDYLLIEYADHDKLYLPVYHLNAIQKYSGTAASVALDKLGGQSFSKAKEKAQEAAKKMAVDLLGLYAQRQAASGFKFSPHDSTFLEFSSKFPFEETPDQLSAIEDTLHDMTSGKIMDRLICGDVGFGKTEIAIRAAFKAIYDGKQVVVLVPTTILAIQHELSFKERLKDYPFSIESVSRFKPPKKQKEILARLAEGKVDLLIGTHRLLSKDVHFKNLGLMVIDEEHRFGVEHKEKLKALRANIPVLTLTATPIPRTLHMALSGLRDISTIQTPPINRLPIKTLVSRFDPEVIKNAISFELSRGGQVFFVHNRVDSIHSIAEEIRSLIPAVRLKIAHGQMNESELEKTMLSFYHREFDVLLCTTIIESGLDIPSANTIIINRADMLGLAQLYQIRGRVGRGQERGYAYLLIPSENSISELAKKRIEVLQRYVELGSGFQIASHDLEIRGGGNLLGPEQSGHVSAVGFDLFIELLDEAVHEAKKQPLEASHIEPEIKVPFSAYLPDTYVADIHHRLTLYRRLSSSTDLETAQEIEAELMDRFGPLPEVVTNLLWLIRIKILLKAENIQALSVGKGGLSLMLGATSTLNIDKIISFAASHPNEHQISPDSKWVVKTQTPDMKSLFFEIEKILALAKR